jgi:hypothetical protein
MFRLFGAGVSKFNAIGLAVSAKTASFTVTQEGTDNSANNVVIQGSGGETVEDGTVTLAARYTSVTLISDGTQWWII